MEAKVIKTEEEYRAALAEAERLMDSTRTEDVAKLELLGILIEHYENHQFPMPHPDPVTAIQFRMEQAGLSRKDLAKYIGSASKVSEVLAGKRTLSLAMIRALHEGLGIPAEILLRVPGAGVPKQKHDLAKYPFAEMFQRGYFPGFNGTLATAKGYAEEQLDSLFAVFEEQPPETVYCRKGSRTVDGAALLAWQARAIHLANQESLPPFSRDRLDGKLAAETIKLSYYAEGPRLAKEYLGKKGIHLIILPHLPNTYLDGACFMIPGGRPVIGMTLRHDRLDNFWFTLAHELGHLYLHLDNLALAFFDDTDKGCLESADAREQEANEFARNTLIPKSTWAKYQEKLLRTRTQTLILEVAEALECSPAIIAGRIRWEKQDFSRFPELIGSKHVRNCFPEIPGGQ